MQNVTEVDEDLKVEQAGSIRNKLSFFTTCPSVSVYACIRGKR